MKKLRPLSLVSDAAKALGGTIGVLINNASTFEDDSALDHTRESWDHHMNINLRAPILLSQKFAQHLEGTNAAS